MSSPWYTPLIEAIPERHSVRTFLPDSLSAQCRDAVSQYPANLFLPFSHNTTFAFFQAVPGKKLYNNGINPVDNLALLSQTDLLSISKTGFIGELLMLYAVSLGISTCWFGHYKLSQLGRYIPNIASKERIQESTLGYGYGNHVDVGERAICCIPLGHYDEKSKRLLDIIMKRMSQNRKPLEALLENPQALNSIPSPLNDVLKLARLSPSAGNSQMWRFGFRNNFKTITIAKPIGYKHFKWEHPDVDIGICAAHLWLGLLKKGFQPRVDVSQNANRALWTFKI